ncbi:hypothetical protein THASP1DRAFT_31294 [Thamnocephalis sphaerospora]|uniref:Transmembrane protein 198 n=1 Tax=Thamnocephalis sphaerospora TaxID=78915 RepID=A0A4P9XM28_9FUNG|nr:hypothetical protein THASP1DRAFT_31294 [Thamnocephalis sphaerospora]|eukprot:RKP06892.1 hypothetical protein THASP1DRAFT_31294 [Thamnocephalis sphaerospora]
MLLMLILSLLMSLLAASAEALVLPDKPEITTRDNGYTPQAIIAALLCLGIGAFLCFFGYKYFRLTTFFGGFGIFAFLAYVGCINISPMTGEDGDGVRRTIYIVVVVALGLIGGLLGAVFWRAGLTMLGALAGLVVTLFVLALAPGGLVKSNIGRALIIVAMVLICSFLVNKYQRPSIIIGTAISGAFSIGIGIDLFAKSQLVTSIAAFLTDGEEKPDAVYTADAITYVILGLIAILAAAGIFVQFRYHKPDFTDDVPPQCPRHNP